MTPYPVKLACHPLLLVDHDHEPVVDALPLDVGDFGLLGGVPHRQQEEQLLVLGAVEERAQRRPAVHRRRRQRREARVVHGRDEQA